MNESLSILVLEDDPIRMVQFRRRLEETGLAHTITHSETAKGAIEHLSQSHFDLVLLDHDLGGRTYVDHSDEAEDCGMRVAEFLSIHPELINRIGPVIVHSLNGPAAQSMVGLIGEASWVPFLWTEAVWRKFLKMPYTAPGVERGRVSDRSGILPTKEEDTAESATDGPASGTPKTEHP